MIYKKPTVVTVQISAPPLSANFAPPPISRVPLPEKLPDPWVKNKESTFKLDVDETKLKNN